MLRIGHRGAKGHVMENTLASFDKAIEFGCDMIECDVRRCKSGEIIVFHDEDLDRLAGRPEFLEFMNLDAVREVELEGGYRIPTLEETITHIAGRASLCIELKEKRLCHDVAKHIQSALDAGTWNIDQFCVISFYHHELVTMKQLLPAIKTGPIVVGIPEGYAKFAEELNADLLHPAIDFIDQDFIDDAHQRGLKVNIWTANEADDIAKARKLGVDGITSDYPDRV